MRIAPALLAAALTLRAGPATAYPAGIIRFSGAEGMTCNACHYGGLTPEVEILGPAEVAPGSRSTYRVVVSGGQNDGGGYNLFAAEGGLAVPEGNLDSRIQDGQLTQRLASRTGDRHEWVFEWTAPDHTADVLFSLAGVSVLLDANLAGDRGATARLTVRVAGGPCPDRDGDGTEDSPCNPDPDAGGGDCRDTAPRIHPGAAEACDGLDDDCDGEVDEGCANDGGAATGTQPGDLLHPLEDPDLCAECHATYEDEASFDTWAGSPMGNAARDPLFLAALSESAEDRPSFAALCIRCHAPGAWLSGAEAPDDLVAEDADREGVLCGICHRAVSGTDFDEEAPYLGNARIFLEDGFTQFGPYEDPRGPHDAEHGAHLGSPELCGACHDATNPDVAEVDPETGEPLGRAFPLSRTYSEWKVSAFARRDETCQSCHMPVGSGRAAWSPGAIERTEVTVHELVGGNTWVLETARASVEGRRREILSRGIEAARAMLRRAATIEVVEAPRSASPGEEVEVTVRVTNRTGHRLPTGHPPGRRVWIEASAGPAEGDPFFTSGAYDEETATIERDPDLRTYEARIGVHGRGETLGLSGADHLIEDTRLPPEGFVPTPDLVPIGRDFSDGAGGFRHWDDATYRLVVPDDSREAFVFAARLLQQVVTREYVEFLRDENRSDARGEELGEAWERTGRAPPEEIAAVSISIRVDPAIPEAAHAAKGGGCACRAPSPPPSPSRGSASASWTCLVALALAGRRRTGRARGSRPGAPG